MRRGVARAAGAAVGVAPALPLAGRGGPDAGGQTLAQTRQTPADAGVPEGNITVTGASPDDSATLEVACPEEDDGDRKGRCPGGGRRGG